MRIDAAHRRLLRGGHRNVAHPRRPSELRFVTAAAWRGRSRRAALRSGKRSHVLALDDGRGDQVALRDLVARAEVRDGHLRPVPGADGRRARGFPQCPPFGGAFAEVIPHLTVGDRPEGGPGVLRAAEAEVLAALPVRTHVTRAWLMTGTLAPGSWQLRAAFPLGI